MLNLWYYYQKFLKFQPYLWPLVVGLSSAVVFYYLVYFSPRFKLRHPDTSQTSTQSKDIVVSLFANQTILREDDFSLINENLNLFLTICSKTKLYVIVQVPSESAIDIALSSFESSGAFNNGLLKHRVMFCQYPNGRISMVQQLHPHIHVELDSANVDFVNTKLLRQNVTTFHNMESILTTQTYKSDQIGLS